MIIANNTFQKEMEEWRRPKNFNKALGEAQHLIEYADMNKVIMDNPTSTSIPGLRLFCFTTLRNQSRNLR